MQQFLFLIFTTHSGLIIVDSTIVRTTLIYRKVVHTSHGVINISRVSIPRIVLFIDSVEPLRYSRKVTVRLCPLFFALGIWEEIFSKHFLDDLTSFIWL